MFTLYDYERNGAEIQEDFGWFRSLPLYHQTEQFIFCHAGLTYPDLISNSEEDLLWGRSWLEIDARPREKRVIFGHTPFREVPCFPRTGDIGIDGGCVFGNQLCAMILSIPEKVLIKVANPSGFLTGKITSKSIPCVTERKKMTTKLVTIAART